MPRFLLCLLVLAVGASGGVAATATPGTPTPGGASSAATVTPPSITDGTAVATDGPFGGFTLGAGLIAILVAGGYRYLRE